MGRGAIQRRIGDLRTSMTRRGIELLVLDPTGGVGDGTTFRDVATAYVQRVAQHTSLDAESRQLAEFLSTTRETAGEALDDVVETRYFESSMGRLWERLSSHRPAVLMVVNAAECSSSERSALERFISEHLRDPILELAPDAGTAQDVRGCVALVGDAGQRPPLEIDEDILDVVDLSDEARDTVRSYLTQQEVVERFVSTTGGDPGRLDVLMEAMPDDCTNFWEFRYRQLPAERQVVVDLLAVADVAVPVDVLQDAYRRVEGGSASAAVQDLSSEGFLSRSIQSECVTVQLEDPGFGDSLVQRMEPQIREPLHRALAEAAADSHHLNELGDEFVATHFLAAGSGERGFEYGRRAARRLHSHHALEEARDLFESLLDYAPSDDKRREIFEYLVDTYEGLGELDQAMEACRKLRESADDETDRSRVDVRRAQILTKRGQLAEAADLYTGIFDAVDFGSHLWARAKLGLSDVEYNRGRYEQAEEHASDVLSMTEDSAEGDEGRLDVDESTADQVGIRARNQIAKVAVMGSKADEARSLFEVNRRIAEDWNWSREIDRADKNLAICHMQEGDYEQAISVFEEVLSRAGGTNGMPQPQLLLNLGMALQRKNEYDAALERYQEALRAARQIGDERVYGVTAYNLGTLYQDLGAWDRLEAISNHLEAQQDREDRHNYLGSLPKGLRAKLHLDRGEFAEMLDVTTEWVDSNESGAAEGPTYRASVSTPMAHAQLGQIQAARRALEDLEPDDGRTDSDVVRGWSEVTRALLAEHDERWTDAVAAGKKAAETMEEAGFFRYGLIGTLARVRALRALDREAESESVASRAFSELQRRAEQVPEAFRSDYYRVHYHWKLLEAYRDLKGDLPSEVGEWIGSAEDADAADRAVEPVERDAASDDAFRAWRAQFGHIVGENDQMLRVLRHIDHVADSRTPVLIEGESGTGKELMAETLHGRGASNQSETFVKISCGAYGENLLLSELFGHEKGAFPGAARSKKGRVAEADGGTLFLEGVDAMSAKGQVALLELIKNGEYEPVGSDEVRSADVRVVAATSHDLEQVVTHGKFRRDLYYQLKGVVLELPPLRERREDIPRFLRYFGQRFGEGDVTFGREAQQFLASYNWPGNVRELENFVRSVLLFVDGDTVTIEHIREFNEFFEEGDVDLEAPDIDYDPEVDDIHDVVQPGWGGPTSFDEVQDALVEEIVADRLSISDMKKRIEHKSIRRALLETEGNITRAAEILQMTRPRLSQIVNGDDDLLALKEKLVS
jgi:DNA-binding NtrC family response regulator